MTIFDEEDIVISGDTESCPSCNRDGGLMDMVPGSTDKQLAKVDNT
jgi:hypothetical protein